MQFEDLDSGGEGDLFLAHVRSGQMLLRLISCAGVLLWLTALYFWVVDTDQDPIEWVIVATMITVAALVSLPIVRFMGYATVRVSVTSSFISVEHQKLLFGSSTKVLVASDLEPKIEMRTAVIGRGSKRKKVKRYSVTYGQAQLIDSLDYRVTAQAFADRVSQAIESNTRQVATDQSASDARRTSSG